MTSEIIIYKGMPTSNKLTVEKSLELQQWILDPDSRPYYTHSNDTNEIVAHSAGVEEVGGPTKSIVEKQLELQQMILGS